MAHLRVTITAQSPLCFSERRPDGQFRYSTDYVPGTVLRGAAAAIMLRAGQRHETSFQRLFGTGQAPAALFRSAYPDAHLLPHTAVSCKDYPGFGRTEVAHGAFDTLMDRLCFEHLQPPGLLFPVHCRYDGCEPGRTEAFTGFYDLADGQYHTRRISQRLLTRVGINRRRMAAEDELLYAPMVLTEARWHGGTIEQTEFLGTVWVEDDLDEMLTAVLQAVRHVGSGAARGLGQVQVTCKLGEASRNRFGPYQALADRLTCFNQALQGRWALLGQLCDDPPPCPRVFTIGLYADAILKEQDWLPTNVLSAEMLQDIAHMTDPSIRLLRAYASYDYRGGWHTGQRLPKDTELVTRMGSVFVFQTDDLDRWLPALIDLERSGIGERTAEGFGEVVVCDAFHVEGREPK